MRILVCSQEYGRDGSGIAFVVEEVVARLRKKGHTVSVCSPHGPDIRLGSPGFIRRCGGLGLVWFWSRVRRMLAVSAHEYDVVWCHNPLFLRPPTTQNVLATSHGGYQRYAMLSRTGLQGFFMNQYFSLMKAIERYSLSRSARTMRFTALSQQVESELKEAGVPASQIKIIGNGVDTTRFTPGKVRSPPRLLYIGRFAHMKNVTGLIETLKKARKQVAFDFRLVGDGSMLEQARAAADETAFEFLGRLPREDIMHEYREADVYVMASEYEGQPLTVLEAMSAGLPCILNDIPVLRAMVRECGEGLVVNFRNESRAAKAIVTYLTQTDLSAASKRVRDYACKHLDWDNIVQLYEQEFVEVMHG